MQEIVFKVAPTGEGKTKWLLKVAKTYADKNIPVYLYTDETHVYVRFCEKYFKLYSEVCPVKKLNDSNMFNLSNDSVVLIDDLLTEPWSSTDLKFLQRTCYKLYITMTGITAAVPDVEECKYEQLSIFEGV